GARVFIADLDRVAGERVVAGIRKQGGEAEFIQCDVSSSGQVARAVIRAAGKAGRIDVLCNNAAYISRQWHKSGEAPDEEWEKSFRVSLLGTQHFTREALRFMEKQKGGSIINISSMVGLVGGRSSAAYISIKHALVGFTRSVAYDYGPHNIRCNVLCPGPITTRISPKPGSELYQRQISRNFLGRVGKPR